MSDRISDSLQFYEILHLRQMRDETMILSKELISSFYHLAVIRPFNKFFRMVRVCKDKIGQTV